jgi:transcription termination factor Rho
MYTIDDLNVRLLSELKEIAEQMGIKNAKKLAKQDLIYKILDQQAVNGEPVPAPKSNTESGERKLRPRKRENVTAAPKVEQEMSSDEIGDNGPPRTLMKTWEEVFLVTNSRRSLDK